MKSNDGKGLKSDSQNVSEIYLEFKSPLKRFIERHIPSKDDSEDILQNVFYQLSRLDLESQPIEQMSAWLYRVARNQIVDHQRKKKEDRFPSIAETEEESIALMQDMMSLESVLGDDTPETDFYRSVIRKELQTALDELPEDQSKVFILTEMEGFSFKEISEATGIGINTLISRKRYAVLHLRNRLAALYEDLKYML